MAKVLKASLPQACIGCELCIMEMQKQMHKAGLNGSLIRILKNRSETTSRLEYNIDLDRQINAYDIKKIRDICPTGVFTVEESQDELLS